MGCSCGKPSEVHLIHLPELCKECFINTLKRRIKRELRGLHTKNVLLAEDNSAASVLLKTVLSETGIRVEKDNLAQSYDVILVPFIADDLVRDFLNEVLHGKEAVADSANVIRPLRSITEQEIEEFARLENLPFQKKTDELHSFVEELEKKYPSAKFAILKSFEALKK